MTGYMRLTVTRQRSSPRATGAYHLCRAGELLPQAGERLQAQGQDHQGEIANSPDSLAQNHRILLPYRISSGQLADDCSVAR